MSDSKEQSPSADETPVTEVVSSETTNEASADDSAGEVAQAADSAATEEVAEPAAEAVPEKAAPADDSAVEVAQAADSATAEEVAEPAVQAVPEESAVAEDSGSESPATETAEAATAKADEPAAESEEAAASPADEAVGSTEGSVEAAEESNKDTKKALPVVESVELQVLREAQASKDLVEGRIIGWNRGGFHVALGRIAAFCPVSQIEIGSPKSPKRYLDQNFKFRVLEIHESGRRVVVSRAEAIRAEREERAALVRERLEVGAVLPGKVSSLTTFGAFVDLGDGMEGLVHVSEISRRRIELPKEVLKVGQEVEVKVLKIEKGGKRVSLSMKRLEADPWKDIAERMPPGTPFEGVVMRRTDFGVFVEVEPGLEGLLHSSRLLHNMRLEADALDVGKTISGWVHEVERKRRRLSLSLREVVTGDPWKEIDEKYGVGELVSGRVERLARFGAFIELEPGLTGLLPFANLSGGAAPQRQFHPGKEVSVRILSVDKRKKRISLGTESSKAEGSDQDFREYRKSQQAASASGGLTALGAAFEKLKRATEQQVGD